MFKENTDRNFLVYELWKKGYTIDEIAFETAIPRSTVGYYVRKFNKCAKSGAPIVFQQVREQPDEKAMAFNVYLKKSQELGFVELLKKGEIDKVYKLLMILKLSKELQRELSPTKEEGEAFLKHIGYVIKQVSLANKLTSK